MSEKQKKPVFKKWWFWLIVIIVVGAIASAGGDRDTPNKETPTIAESEQNKEIPTRAKGEQSKEVSTTAEGGQIKEPPQEDEQQKEEQPAEQSTEEYTNTAVEVELFAGEFTVGEDVVPGRYDVTSVEGMGNFVVYDGEIPVVNEILTDKSGSKLGVTRLQIDLYEGNKIQISGINKVLLKPAEIELKTTLVSGNHLVGRDVPAGTYIVTAPEGTGNFVVYDNDIPVVNEILGSSDIGVEKIKISIKEGQMIVISGLEKVELKSR